MISYGIRESQNTLLLSFPRWCRNTQKRQKAGLAPALDFQMFPSRPLVGGFSSSISCQRGIGALSICPGRACHPWGFILLVAWRPHSDRLRAGGDFVDRTVFWLLGWDLCSLTPSYGPRGSRNSTHSSVKRTELRHFNRNRFRPLTLSAFARLWLHGLTLH